MSATPSIRDMGLVRRVRDEDDETLQRPLEWSLIRRMFTYTAPIKGKVTALVVLSLIRAAQLPALVLIMSETISGPITAHDLGRLAQAVAAYGLLAIATEGLFHFRYRYALQIAETVVNGLRADIFRCVQRQPQILPLS